MAMASVQHQDNCRSDNSCHCQQTGYSFRKDEGCLVSPTRRVNKSICHWKSSLSTPRYLLTTIIISHEWKCTSYYLCGVLYAMLVHNIFHFINDGIISALLVVLAWHSFHIHTYVHSILHESEVYVDCAFHSSEPPHELNHFRKSHSLLIYNHFEYNSTFHLN